MAYIYVPSTVLLISKTEIDEVQNNHQNEIHFKSNAQIQQTQNGVPTIDTIKMYKLI